MRLLKTNEEFTQNAIKLHYNKYDYSLVKYVGAHKHVIIKCYLHGKFNQIANSHLRGRGCPKCQKNEKIYTTHEFITRARRVHGNMYDYSNVEFKHSFKNINIRCLNHGIFLQLPNKHLQRRGCPKCNFSKGEQRILKWMSDNKIKYTIQKTFNNCINIKTNRKLKFDFYLPIQNLLIEFDGRQHYEDISTTSFKRELLNNIQFRDAIKTKYATDNNIKLLRIPYFRFNDIENILNNKVDKI